MRLADNCTQVLRACEYIGVNIDDFNLTYNMFLRDTFCRSIHGINHIYRTMTVCALLGESLQNPRAGLLAFCGAYIHDLARMNDDMDSEHGQRAADMFFHRFDSLWDRYGLTERERKFVAEAVAQHSTCEWMQPSDEGYDVMAILKDADALDRCRLGDDGVNPALLRLPNSRLLIETAKSHFVSTEYCNKPLPFREFIQLYNSEMK